MLFDWRDYLKLAKSLIGQASSGYSQEAARRSAVSRAYYAAFCWARNYAEANLGFRRTGKAEDHGYLRTHLSQRGMARIASNLNKLRQWRNDCDYEDRVPNLVQRANFAIQIADKVIQSCR